MIATFCSKILNFDKFITDSYIDQFPAQPIITKACHINVINIPFVGKGHSYIEMVDQYIKKTNNVRKIICKNVNYYEH